MGRSRQYWDNGPDLAFVETLVVQRHFYHMLGALQGNIDSDVVQYYVIRSTGTVAMVVLFG